MATREQIIHDQHDASRGLTLQERADIKILAQTIKFAILNSPVVLPDRPNSARMAYTALVNVLADLIGNVLVQDEAELITLVQTLLPMYVAAYKQKEKTL